MHLYLYPWKHIHKWHIILAMFIEIKMKISPIMMESRRRIASTVTSGAGLGVIVLSGAPFHPPPNVGCWTMLYSNAAWHYLLACPSAGVSPLTSHLGMCQSRSWTPAFSLWPERNNTSQHPNCRAWHCRFLPPWTRGKKRHDDPWLTQTFSSSTRDSHKIPPCRISLSCFTSPLCPDLYPPNNSKNKCGSTSTPASKKEKKIIMTNMMTDVFEELLRSFF